MAIIWKKIEYINKQIPILIKSLEKISYSIYNTYVICESIRNKGKSNLIDGSEVAVAVKDKNVWILLIFLLSGLVIGGLLGEIASRVDFLWWLAYGDDFGIKSPVNLDFSVLKITFSLIIKINIASIIGMAIAIFIYRKV